MKRHKHSLSHYKLVTLDMGQLVPVACFEVLPGDSVQQSTSALVRCSPLLTPVMHPVVVRIHHWFVPNRLLWEGWEDFITGGPDGIGGDSGPYPIFTVPSGGVAIGSLADYLGIPTGGPPLQGMEVSQLPFLAYEMIFNEFYRDQDLVAELDLTQQPEENFQSGDRVQVCAWEKDYFTAARLFPQKGPDISLPIGQSAPVIGRNADNPIFSVGGNNSMLASQSDSNTTWLNTPGASNDISWTDPALIADLSQATAVNVNDVRLAFALQRYQEARSRYGSRYTEYLRYLGVRSSDARLQRPEYLGGGKQTISFSEVLQTGGDAAEGSPIATMYGHGISAMRSRRYRRFFEEHGHVLSLMSVRPKSMYANGLHRMWSRRTKEDYWQRELEHIGQQEIFGREVFARPDVVPPNATSGNRIFGYQDRYSEYKHLPSMVAAEFRDTLSDWHLARLFETAPQLNESFVSCVPTKRVFAAQGAEDVLWVMAAHSIQSRRLVSRSPASRII